MKKLLLAFTLIALSATVFSQAKSAGIKTNPLGMAIGIFNLSYESALNEGSSIQINTSAISLDLLGTDLSGFGIGAEYRDCMLMKLFKDSIMGHWRIMLPLHSKMIRRKVQ